MDTSLKQEIEAESKAATRHKIILRVLLGLVAFIILSGLILFEVATEASHKEITTAPVASDDSTEANTNTKPADISSSPNTTPSSSSITASPTSAPQSYTPIPTSLNRSAFIAQGRQIATNYGQIVNLVTFNSSLPDSEKASRIKQAKALDGQYFKQVTNLRGQLVGAGISSGPYMDATQLAENGVSAISVGLTFMNYWADNPSRTSDLNGGLGNVSQGSSALLQFSQKLSAL